MNSVASGLTALSPSIGQAEDFIAKKGIPEDQVPAFLAKLGDPQLAGLIAQKQRLKQEQAKQVPPGGTPAAPPTVKDDINQKLAQLLQSRQQSQQASMQQMQNPGMPPQGGQPGMPPQGAQPPQGGPPQGGQPGMPPQGAQPPQGGPPVQAAGGGLMSAGLGGLDAGSMEAPHHFDGGGIVAFTAGGTTPKSKDEQKDNSIEGRAHSEYQDIYDLQKQHIEDLKGTTAYHQIAGTEEDPAVALEKEQIENRRALGRSDYAKESGYEAEMAGWMHGLGEAFKGKSLGSTLVSGYETTAEKKAAAREKYRKLNDTLDEQNLAYVKAMTAAKDSNNKRDYDHAEKIRDSIYSTIDAMHSTKLAEVKFDADRSDKAVEHDLRRQEIANQRAQINKPTDMSNATLDLYHQYKAQQAKGSALFKGMSDAEIRGMARKDAMTLVTGAKTTSAETQNWVDNIPKFQEALTKANAAVTRAGLAGDRTSPEYVAALQAQKQAQRDYNEARERAGLSSDTSGGSSGAGSSSSGVDTNNPLLR